MSSSKILYFVEFVICYILLYCYVLLTYNNDNNNNSYNNDNNNNNNNNNNNHHHQVAMGVPSSNPGLKTFPNPAPSLSPTSLPVSSKTVLSSYHNKVKNAKNKS